MSNLTPFKILGQKFINFSIGLLKNWRNQKVTLRLTDLSCSYWVWIFPIDFRYLGCNMACCLFADSCVFTCREPEIGLWFTLLYTLRFFQKGEVYTRVNQNNFRFTTRESTNNIMPYFGIIVWSTKDHYFWTACLEQKWQACSKLRFFKNPLLGLMQRY